MANSLLMSAVRSIRVYLGYTTREYTQGPKIANKTMLEIEARLNLERDLKQLQATTEKSQELLQGQIDQQQTLLEEMNALEEDMGKPEVGDDLMNDAVSNRLNEDKDQMDQEPAEEADYGEDRIRKLFADVRQLILKQEMEAESKRVQENTNKKFHASWVHIYLKMNIERESKIVEESVSKVNIMLDQARKMAENGLQQLPTSEEFQNACEVALYDPSNFHFAVAGKSGTGKSSLINAFLNMGPKDQGAIPSGTTETTNTIGRYPDHSDRPPRRWIVWYDVPGAGTIRCPGYQCFINQGLFIFDFILITIGDRFEEGDIELLKNCRAFDIPSFIVRSKADSHIRNEMAIDDDDKPVDRHSPLYLQSRQKFINDTRKSIAEQLSLAKLPQQNVYIVSRKRLRQAYHAHLGGLGWVSSTDLIDELTLIKDLMHSAYERRTNHETHLESKSAANSEVSCLYPIFCVYFANTFGPKNATENIKDGNTPGDPNL